MIGEVQVLDIFAPIALVWAIAAGVLMVLLKSLLRRSGLYAWVWYPGLFDLALYCCLWTGIGFTVHLFSTAFSMPK
jgi:hypothetical protein